MGLFETLRSAFAPPAASGPVVAEVQDATPPEDPNDLGGGYGGGQARGPSAFFNVLQGIGLPTDPSWWDSWRYPRRLKERQRESFNRDALIRRVLSIKADDSTRVGWLTEVAPPVDGEESYDPAEIADALQDYEDRETIALRSSIAEAVLRADLYGYAIIWLGLHDSSGDVLANEDGRGTTDPSEPVNVESIETIAWAKVFDARDVQIDGIHGPDSKHFGTPTAFIITDIQSAVPEGWRTDKPTQDLTRGGPRRPLEMPTTVDGRRLSEIRVDASRCLLFMAPDSIPVPDTIQWHLANYMRAQHAVSRGAADHTVDVYGIKGWKWKAWNRDQGDSIKRISMMQRMKSALNAVVHDKEEESFTRSTSAALTGLADTVGPSMVDISASLGFSIMRVFGVSPAGFSSGDGNIRNDQATVSAYQTKALVSQIRKFQGYALVADDFTGPKIELKPGSREIKFNDLTPTDETEADAIRSQQFEDATAMYDNGGMDRDEYRRTVDGQRTASFSMSLDLKKPLKTQPEPQLVGIFTGIIDFKQAIFDRVMEPSEARAALGKADEARYSPMDLLSIFPDPVEAPPTPEGPEGLPDDPEAPGDLEDEVELEPDLLEEAFSKDPLPGDTDPARALAQKLSEKHGHKFPTGRITKWHREGKLRAWNFGGKPVYSMREVMQEIANLNGYVTDDDAKQPLFLSFELPPVLAAMIPAKPEDSSAPHVTLMYYPDVPDDQLAGVLDYAREQCSKLGAATLSLGDNVEYFDTPKGWAAHIPVSVSHKIQGLHDRLTQDAKARGLPVSKHADYKPHVTLQYLEEPDYQGPTPRGRWDACEVAVSRDDKTLEKLPCAVVTEEQR